MSTMNVGGLLNARNGIPADNTFRHQLHQQPVHLDTHSGYGIQHPTMRHHQHSLSQPMFAQMSAPQQQMMPASYMSSHAHSTGKNQMDPNDNRPKTEPAPKAYACSTCGKGFARRSDLARHERIHSGIRPHACDYPGCGKEFIQRSALTVHTRVHTGEKPHMCERCGKPFSDSSSLARHRRIHSGKRPYKCPYANCQKTFTRRTTLTRHQNHHTGTVEQAQAETNAKLSNSQPQSQPQSASGSYSDHPTPDASGSPSQAVPVSPNHNMNAMQVMVQQNNDFQFMPHQQHAMSSQMRAEYHGHANRINQSISTTFAGMPQGRVNMSAHPGGSMGMPQTIEPRTAGNGSPNASPHLTSLDWVSSNNPTMTSQPSMEAFYQDPNAYGHQSGSAYGPNNVYYASRRPQSTEPEEFVGYRPRSHMNNHHHLATGATMPMSDPNWTHLRHNYAVGH